MPHLYRPGRATAAIVRGAVPRTLSIKASGALTVLVALLLLPLAAYAGTGVFTPHPVTPSFGSGNSQGVALGDMDGDQDLDAVVANLTEGETVWLNNGAGSFTPHPTTPDFEAGNSQDVALGDLDGDGDLDAIFAIDNGSQGGPETVWLNDGAGNLTAHPTTPTFGAEGSMAVALGDLDGDQDLDAVVANYYYQPETVWLNDGAGNFSPHPTIPTFFDNSLSQDVALGDLDGDGDLDAVLAEASGNGPEAVALNDGTGGFTLHPATPRFGANDSYDVALGDIDGDQDLDALIANLGNFDSPGYEWHETVWLNDGAGNFTAHPTTPHFGGEYSEALALSDIDGDADLDAVAANTASTSAETVWLNDGAGNFTAHPTTPTFGAGNSADIALGDLDGDGDPDAVVANYEGEAETVWLNNGESPNAVTHNEFHVKSGTTPYSVTVTVLATMTITLGCCAIRRRSA
ncbi:MAG TPA: FG-GAP-like repeat-containing protein [Ardenticatenaceae bacterium]|jgi:hypothetical protein